MGDWDKDRRSPRPARSIPRQATYDAGIDLSLAAADGLDRYLVPAQGRSHYAAGETVETMGEIIASGKVLYWGLSNYRSWRMAEIVRLCEQMGVPKPVVCQPYYNAMNRMPEVEVLPACAHYGMGVVPYSPLARGVLTKYDPKAKPGRDPGRAWRSANSRDRVPQRSLVMAQRSKRMQRSGHDGQHFCYAMGAEQ